MTFLIRGSRSSLVALLFGNLCLHSNRTCIKPSLCVALHLIFTRQQQQPQQCACSDGCLLPGTLGRQIHKKLLIVWVCPQIATSIAEPCDIVLCALLTRAHGYHRDGRQRGSVRPCRCYLDNDLNLLLMDIIFSLMTSLRFDGVLNVRQS